MSTRPFYVSLFILALSLTQNATPQVTRPQTGVPANPSVSTGLSNQQPSSATSGQISGVVATSDGRPIPYAVISMWGGKGQTVFITAGEDGQFEAYQLAPGHYELSASLGLREARSGVDVSPGISTVTLTIPPEGGSNGNGETTVSVAQLAVPDKARHELQKAEDSFRRSRLAEAATHTEKALTLWPRYVAALLFRAALELTQNSPTLAQADAEKAIGYDPSDAKAYVLLGSSYNRLHRWDDALRTLDRGISIAPAYWPGHYELSKALLAKRDFAAALQQAEQASIPATANYAPLHMVKGYAYLGLGNDSAAGQELETSLKLDPTGSMAPHIRETLDQLHDCSTRKEDCVQN